MKTKEIDEILEKEVGYEINSSIRKAIDIIVAKALKDIDKRFTEEDIIKAIGFGVNYPEWKLEDEDFNSNNHLQEFLQSLNK